MDIYCESWQKKHFSEEKFSSEKLRLMLFIKIATLHFGNQTYSIKPLSNCFLHLFGDGWYLVHLVILQSKGNFQESVTYTEDIPTVLTKLSNVCIMER